MKTATDYKSAAEILNDGEITSAYHRGQLIDQWHKLHANDGPPPPPTPTAGRMRNIA